MLQKIENCLQSDTGHIFSFLQEENPQWMKEVPLIVSPTLLENIPVQMKDVQFPKRIFIWSEYNSGIPVGQITVNLYGHSSWGDYKIGLFADRDLEPIVILKNVYRGIHFTSSGRAYQCLVQENETDTGEGENGKYLKIPKEIELASDTLPVKDLFLIRTGDTTLLVNVSDPKPAEQKPVIPAISDSRVIYRNQDRYKGLSSQEIARLESLEHQIRYCREKLKVLGQGNMGKNKKEERKFLGDEVRKLSQRLEQERKRYHSSYHSGTIISSNSQH